MTDLIQGGSSLLQVLVDVNWRPVFFSDVLAAPAIIKPYVERADIVKVTDEEAEWLWGISAADALQHPEKVCLRALHFDENLSAYHHCDCMYIDTKEKQELELDLESDHVSCLCCHRQASPD